MFGRGNYKEAVKWILLIGLTQVCSDRKQQVEQKDMSGLQLGEKGTRGNLTCRSVRDKVPVTISVTHVWLKKTHKLCRETTGTAPRDQHFTNLRLQDRKSKFI